MARTYLFSLGLVRKKKKMEQQKILIDNQQKAKIQTRRISQKTEQILNALGCNAHEISIVILDDPISQVDIKTGETIINTIRSMAGKKTIIIVSHRLSAVRFADQIITLDRGRIIESGKHSELMANDRYYAKTYRLQEIEEEYAY